MEYLVLRWFTFCVAVDVWLIWAVVFLLDKGYSIIVGGLKKPSESPMPLPSEELSRHINPDAALTSVI